MDILVTSGGTKIPVDRVRDITNMSNGTFGSRIAHAALEAGHAVHFLCAKHSKTPFSKTLDYSEGRDWMDDINEWANFWNFCEEHAPRYRETRFRNYDDYAQNLEVAVQMGKPDVVILAAAVSDYGVTNFVEGKVRTGSQNAIQLFPLPKLINRIKRWHPNCLLVGFKLLMNSNDEQLIKAARMSLRDNGCDFVVANDLRDLQANNHRLLIVREDEVHVFSKSDSPDPLYLAKKVIEEVHLCPATSC